LTDFLSLLAFKNLQNTFVFFDF